MACTGMGCRRPGLQAAVAVIIGQICHQLRVQRKTAPGQRLQRSIITPVERQKTAGFAGGGTGGPVLFNNRDSSAAPGQKISGRSADHASTADDNMST